MFAAGMMAGCAATRAPSPQDKDYPPGWPSLIRLDNECHALDGAYENGGVAVNPRGVIGVQQFAELLTLGDVQITRGVSNVQLVVTTRKRDQHQDTFATLHAVATSPGQELEREFDAFCVKGVLFFVGSLSSSGDALGFRGEQHNVWLGLATDGSLIVKMGNYTVGMLLGVPYGGERVSWARYERVPQQSR